MSATGILELSKLLKSMRPVLDPHTYVFATIAKDGSRPEHAKLLTEAVHHAEMLFKEDEGWTVIVTQTLANELNLAQNFPCRKVTLNVHSSLDAVGFLAAITTRLAQKLNLGVNPVSGYYHDHLFVPKGKEDLVVKEIETMAAEQE
ncbi:hypothetical protein D0869_14061 [Hortaea werneckii]|uniref:DUF2241 domain-containing protein n=1 Tax=Hortaea werneckii TaxID=91943 RepID=A0A3M7A8M5_HORWE|nr:hypothetical protein KC334_g9032 [Hortaea werneckii]KAI7018668.1 hypothetical protein KC355_g3268 [Hortaea werneckii]KAI7106627.1 hypothetical protein KC324_g20428 [Hortaea werneckii]KAI7524190.1 hypothetical protein KC316_g18783 [Hortaea werneckii]KAI7669343.1 hypothetical protein KC318_g4725 [Hortaea werneckii]